jgi:nucleoside 2-deoxyribosyltransferase
MLIPIYPASPLGFSEAGRHFYNGVFLPTLRNIGFDPLDPWTLTDEKLIQAAISAPEGVTQKQEWIKLNPIIGANNAAAIRRCRMVVAILDGVDVDSGTASEIGYAAALGKPIVGYRGDFRLSADNVGSMVNLQVEYFIRLGGGEIVTSLGDLWPLLRRWHERLQERK